MYFCLVYNKQTARQTQSGFTDQLCGSQGSVCIPCCVGHLNLLGSLSILLEDSKTDPFIVQLEPGSQIYQAWTLLYCAIQCWFQSAFGWVTTPAATAALVVDCCCSGEASLTHSPNWIQFRACKPRLGLGILYAFHHIHCADPDVHVLDKCLPFAEILSMHHALRKDWFRSNESVSLGECSIWPLYCLSW